jgi:hypothetical protein
VLDLKACCWALATASSKQDATAAVPAVSAAVPAGAAGRRGRASKVLSITLVRPGPTPEEAQYKRGVRADNASAERPPGMHGSGHKGWRFFADDEDHFGLEELLQVGEGGGTSCCDLDWCCHRLCGGRPVMLLPVW